MKIALFMLISVAAGAQEVIVARDGADLEKSLPNTVTLSPQLSIHLNDRTVKSGPRSLTVRAVTTATDLKILLEWADETEDRAGSETNQFGDSVAIELPQHIGARLPYIGMGDEEQPVLLYHARAGENETLVREAVAAGFGSSTRADLGGARFEMKREGGKWRALFVRPLQAVNDLRQGLVPIAFAVWDGHSGERGGNKALSSWKFLRLEKYPANDAYLREATSVEEGDPARGKLLVESMCVGCHHVGDKKLAPAGLAPDLSDVGAIALPAYLRESIVAPSAVIVPNPNINQHYNKAAPADSNRAYPNNEQFVWWAMVAGKKTSRMPPFAGLPPADISAIVSYLRTLGRNP